MRWSILITAVLILTPASLHACPLCREAVSKTSGADDEDQYREARAYNNSIYLMVSMPYLLLGGLGFAVYRHLRIKALLEADTLGQSPPGGSPPCPPPSPGADS